MTAAKRTYETTLQGCICEILLPWRFIQERSARDQRLQHSPSRPLRGKILTGGSSYFLKVDRKERDIAGRQARDSERLTD